MSYDLILVVTDRLTKYRLFILYKESFTAEELAYAFLRNVVSSYELLKEIINNKDKLFISKFWKLLMDLMGINYKLFTSFHPTING